MLLRRFATALLVAVIGLSATPAAAQTVRIKDIVSFEGVRDNLLVGYGLVVGLNGTGDTLRNSPFTEQSLVAMLERLGVNVREINVRTRNIGAVMVTATLPPFSRQGARIDINVSALGDSSDLTGGTLLVTPLVGADGEVYAVGQGTVTTSAITAQGDAGSVTRGVPTSARIPSGAIIEREIPFVLNDMDDVTLSLFNPDFTTARRIADAINRELGSGTARALDPGTVEVAVPSRFAGDIVGLITEVENLRIEPDQVARVVIDEASGVIVMGADVRSSTVAISQGNLTGRITEEPQVAQPNALAGGQTAVVPRTNIDIEEEERPVVLLQTGITLSELVEGLNALGVGPRDIITILQSIRAAGALQAEIEVL